MGNKLVNSESLEALIINEKVALAGKADKADAISQTAADERYLKLSGGTMTGDLRLGSEASIADQYGSAFVINGTNYLKLGNHSKPTVEIQKAINGHVYVSTTNDQYEVLDTSNTAANPTLAGTEAELTGLKLAGTNYQIPQGTTVVANPTLAGTEAALEGIQVNNTKYKLPTDLKFTNVSVAAADFASDSTYADYGYKATIPLAGVTTDYYPIVTFAPAEANSGNYAPVAETYNGGVYIYAKVNTAITIQTIYCVGNNNTTITPTTIGGVGGAITLGTGLTMTGNELSASGGGSEQHLYWHTVQIQGFGSSYQSSYYNKAFNAYFIILNTSPTAFTAETLIQLIIDAAGAKFLAFQSWLDTDGQIQNRISIDYFDKYNNSYVRFTPHNTNNFGTVQASNIGYIVDAVNQIF